MKLELKHLASYLPYGLKGIRPDDDELKYQYQLVAINIGVHNTWTPLDFGDSTGLDCKPILRPLSDLTKEIEIDDKINDEKFIPMNLIDGKGSGTLGGNNLREMIEYNQFLNYNYYDLKYATILKLFEWHFDVFGLIEQNLAIDINTL